MKYIWNFLFELPVHDTDIEQLGILEYCRIELFNFPTSLANAKLNPADVPSIELLHII
jgi:hypothetical protein